MKKFVEGIKDFFYDATDYILIVFIIIVVIGVIGWRLDILFTKSPINIAKESNNIISDIPKPQDNDSDNENENSTTNNNEGNSESKPIDKQEKPENNDNENAQTDPSPKDDSEEIVKVKIPNGSLATNIAKILFDKGLINDKNQFLLKTQELGLDTKLKSGTFQIKKNSSLETIVKTIAK